MLRLTEQSLLEQKISQLRIMTAIVASSLAENSSAASSLGTQREAPFSLTILKQLPDELNHQGWWLYSPDRQLIASYRVAEGQPFSAARHQQVRISGQALESVDFPSLLEIFSATVPTAHFAQPLYHNKRFLGILDIRYSLEDIRYRLFLSQRMILVYVLLYGSVLVSIGYYLLQRNVVKPARNLLQATEDVSRGNLETRLPVAGPAEIAHLADAYNHMVEALQESRFETRQHITTLEQTNQELQRTRDELIRSEKMSSVGQLAAGLAHELGNPLTALIGYLEFMKGQLEGDDRELAQRSLTETERIDFLVRELLDFSRPSEIHAEPLAPVELLRSAVRLLKNQGSLVGIEIIDLLPENLPQVMISPHKFQQLLVNLLLNAAHACAGEGQIQLSGGQEKEIVWMTVNDNGCGIAADVIGKVFDPFFTSKQPGEGTGLGLSICHRIVEEAGGRIFAESKLREGSSFRVELPALP